MAFKDYSKEQREAYGDEVLMSASELEELRREVAFLRAVLLGRCRGNLPTAGKHDAGLDHIWNRDGFCRGCGLHVPEFAGRRGGFPISAEERDRESIAFLGPFPLLVGLFPTNLPPPGTFFDLEGELLEPGGTGSATPAMLDVFRAMLIRAGGVYEGTTLRLVLPVVRGSRAERALHVLVLRYDFGRDLRFSPEKTIARLRLVEPAEVP